MTNFSKCAALAAIIIASLLAGSHAQAAADLLSIEVRRDDRVGRPYKVLDEVEAIGVMGTERGELIMMLKQKAGAMGADAVINLSYSTKNWDGYPDKVVCPHSENNCYAVNSNTNFVPSAKGTAIAFTENKDK